MPRTDTHPVLASDLEETIQALGACLTMLQARDLMEAQIAFNMVRPSPLSVEVERLHARFRGYMGDFLLAQHLEEDDSEDEESELGAEDGSEELTEASEALSDAPLGKPNLPKQKGKRLTAEDL